MKKSFSSWNPERRPEIFQFLSTHTSALPDEGCGSSQRKFLLFFGYCTPNCIQYSWGTWLDLTPQQCFARILLQINQINSLSNPDSEKVWKGKQLYAGYWLSKSNSREVCWATAAINWTATVDREIRPVIWAVISWEAMTCNPNRSNKFSLSKVKAWFCSASTDEVSPGREKIHRLPWEAISGPCSNPKCLSWTLFIYAMIDAPSAVEGYFVTVSPPCW